MSSGEPSERARVSREHFSQSHFELRWPAQLLRDELRSLMLPEPRLNDVESLLREVLIYTDGLDEYRGLPDSYNPWVGQSARFWTDKVDWLRDLWRHAVSLPRPEKRPPYWSQRDANGVRKLLDSGQTMQRFVDTISDFRTRGYLANALGQECVDVPDGIEGELGPEPLVQIERSLGKEGIWPPESHWRNYSEDDFFDVVEFTADIVARPRRHDYHSWNECGFHYSSFAREPGLKLYRSRINEILSESSLHLTLGSDGRLERTSTEALEPLVDVVRVSRDEDDPVSVATRQFRQRGAREEVKRQAIVSLAGVLEGRRSMLKENLLSKDESSLFRIANEFDLRHRKAEQLRDYDKNLYFEWIFYWYLSTIRLLDGLLNRGDETPAASDAPPF